jgi:uncharacterized protein YbaP (TraB family)
MEESLMRDVLKLALGAILLAVSLVLPVTLQAKTVAPENCAERPYDKGRLWQVSHDDYPPSYIFGTMHSKDPRILQLPGIIMQAFRTSHTAVFETSLKDEDMAQSQAFMFLPKGESLQNRIGQERFENLSSVISAYGITPQILDRIKIWAAAAIISQPPPPQHRNAPQMKLLDKELEEAARRAGKNVIALETNLEQLGIFDQASEQVQLEYLDQSMIENRVLEEEIETITEYYLTGNTGWIACDLENTIKSKSDDLQDLMTDKLIDERNQRMVDRMSSTLEAGNAFVGIGALHLPGKNGILSLLEQKGYLIERKF